MWFNVHYVFYWIYVLWIRVADFHLLILGPVTQIIKVFLKLYDEQLFYVKFHITFFLI